MMSISPSKDCNIIEAKLLKLGLYLSLSQVTSLFISLQVKRVLNTNHKGIEVYSIVARHLFDHGSSPHDNVALGGPWRGLGGGPSMPKSIGYSISCTLCGLYTLSTLTIGGPSGLGLRSLKAFRIWFLCLRSTNPSQFTSTHKTKWAYNPFARVFPSMLLSGASCP